MDREIYQSMAQEIRMGSSCPEPLSHCGLKSFRRRGILDTYIHVYGYYYSNGHFYGLLAWTWIHDDWGIWISLEGRIAVFPFTQINQTRLLAY